MDSLKSFSMRRRFDPTNLLAVGAYIDALQKSTSNDFKKRRLSRTTIYESRIVVGMGISPTLSHCFVQQLNHPLQNFPASQMRNERFLEKQHHEVSNVLKPDKQRAATVHHRRG